MILRPLVHEDYDSVIALWKETPEMELNSVDDSREGFCRFVSRNPETCLGAFSEGGSLLGLVLASDDGRRGYLYHVTVAKIARGRGIGRALVARVLELFTARGLAKAGLLVFADNEKGISFWEHMGFVTRRDLNYESRVLQSLTRL